MQHEIDRTMLDELVSWKQASNRRPLLLQGARQVGKTWLLNKFGKSQFKDVVYINFEAERQYADFFGDDLMPKRLLDRLSVALRREISSDTLLVFDEVQSCKRALTSLKYFCEFLPSQPVAAAVSCLGVAIRPEETGFPVGKVDIKTLRPIGFREFVIAQGDARLLDCIAEANDSNRPLESEFHDRLIHHVRNYMVVGGMPAVVGEFLSNHETPDWTRVRIVQHELLSGSLIDMARYAKPHESVRIESCWRSIPAQLAKPNQKFQYRVIGNGASASRYDYALDWLRSAELTAYVTRVSGATRPLLLMEEPSAFKAFLFDVGLYSAMAEFSPLDILSGSRTTAFGGLAETFVANELRLAGADLHYWTSGGEAEVDFIFEDTHGIVALEAKSGTSVQSKSMNVLAAKYPDVRGVRISEKNFGTPGRIRSIPLYALALGKGTFRN